MPWNNMMECMWGGMGQGGMMTVWNLFSLLLLIGLIVLAVLAAIWLVRRTGESTSASAQPAETPLDILKRRLAQGEITPEQFESMKGHLQER
jgi:uncharacterized membrane protein